MGGNIKFTDNILMQEEEEDEEQQPEESKQILETLENNLKRENHNLSVKTPI